MEDSDSDVDVKTWVVVESTDVADSPIQVIDVDQDSDSSFDVVTAEVFYELSENDTEESNVQGSSESTILEGSGIGIISDAQNSNTDISQNDVSVQSRTASLPKQLLGCISNNAFLIGAVILLASLLTKFYLPDQTENDTNVNPESNTFPELKFDSHDIEHAVTWCIEKHSSGNIFKNKKIDKCVTKHIKKLIKANALMKTEACLDILEKLSNARNFLRKEKKLRKETNTDEILTEEHKHKHNRKEYKKNTYIKDFKKKFNKFKSDHTYKKFKGDETLKTKNVLRDAMKKIQHKIKKYSKHKQNNWKKFDPNEEWYIKYNPVKNTIELINITKSQDKNILLKNNNKTVSGQWYSNMHSARSEIRNKEKLSDWYFDRTVHRKSKRDKAKWFFDYMYGREDNRHLF